MGDEDKPAVSAGTYGSVRKASPSAEKLPVEQWAADKPHKLVSAEMVRIEMKWPIGFEVTEADYVAACDRVASTPIGFKGAGMTRRLTPTHAKGK